MLNSLVGLFSEHTHVCRSIVLLSHTLDHHIVNMSFHAEPSLNPIETLNLLKGSSLILPIISIGNIPQLSIDLLIHNLPGFKRLGKLDDFYLYPFVSPIDYVSEDLEDDIPPTGIASALDIYHNSDLNLTVLQQRSPILPGFLKSFFQKLMIPFINTAQFDNILILNSNDNGLKPDKFENKKFQIYSSNVSTLLNLLQLGQNEDIAKVGELSEISPVIDGFIKLFNESENSLQSSETASKSEVDLVNLLKENYPLSLPLSREASRTKLSDSMTKNHDGTKPIVVIALSIFAYEGDNSNDAELLATKIIKVLNLTKEVDTFVKPRSWKGVYGDKSVPTGIENGIFT